MPNRENIRENERNLHCTSMTDGRSERVPALERESMLVSACLLGEPCRYDGKSQPCTTVMALEAEYDLVPICPEVLGGLPTPRTPSEIKPDGRVLDRDGNDRTEAFESGADIAVMIAKKHGCRRAILKSKSPSCGVHEIYDGTFTGTLKAGRGIAAARLAEAGIILQDENA